jgi:hypothetical protein
VIDDALRGDGLPPVQYGDLYIIVLVPDNDGPSLVEKRWSTP